MALRVPTSILSIVSRKNRLSMLALLIALIALLQPLLAKKYGAVSALRLPGYNSNSTGNTVDSQTAIQMLSENSIKVVALARESVMKLKIRRVPISRSDAEMVSYFGQLPLSKSDDVGTAFVVRNDGLLLTCYHVVKDAEEIQVMHSDGRVWQGKLVAFDKLTDLALLRVKETDLVSLAWTDEKTTSPGSLVWVAGAPFGMVGSVAMGIVSASPRIAMDGSPMRDYIQTDAAINPGSSGGPMLDQHGKVIGVASAILGEDFRGVGFAFPGTAAKIVCDQLIERGKVQRGWMGGQWGRVTLERAVHAGLENAAGAYLESVDGIKSDALQGDELKVGDVCIQINQMRIHMPLDLTRTIASLEPGSVVEMVVYRDGTRRVLRVNIGTQP